MGARATGVTLGECARHRGRSRWLAVGPGSLLVGLHGIGVTRGGLRWDRGQSQWLAVGPGSLLVGAHGIAVTPSGYASHSRGHCR